MRKNLIDLRIRDCFQFTPGGPVHQIVRKDHDKEILIYSPIQTGIAKKYDYWKANNKKVIISED